jgi:hypothetical protein
MSAKETCWDKKKTCKNYRAKDNIKDVWIRGDKLQYLKMMLKKSGNIRHQDSQQCSRLLNNNMYIFGVKQNPFCRHC